MLDVKPRASFLGSVARIARRRETSLVGAPSLCSALLERRNQARSLSRPVYGNGSDSSGNVANAVPGSALVRSTTMSFAATAEDRRGGTLPK